MRHPQIASRSRLTRLARLLAPLCLAGAMTAGAVGPTFAFGNNGPDLTVNGYGVTVSASVGCDAASRTMAVSASATTFQTMGSFGPTTGLYDAGQYVRYNVWAKDLDASEYAPIYSWSPWQWINSTSSTMYVERMISPQSLGTSVVTGSIGHNYQIRVQVDWWTGVENVVNVDPTYTQTYTADAFNSYVLTTGYCHL